MAVKPISNLEDFEDKKAKGLTIFFFLASWSSLCKKISPDFKELSNDYSKITFYEVDIERVDVKSKVQFANTPVFILFNEGKEIGRVVGNNLPDLSRLVQKHG